MGYARFVGALAVAVAFVFIAFGPMPSGPSHAAPVAQGPFGLLDTWVADPSPYLAAGVQVVEDYGNGYLLVRLMTQGQAASVGGPGLSLLVGSTPIHIFYSGIAFDTSEGAPALPADLLTANADAHLVQFVGPIKADWIAGMERSGLTFEQYLDAYTFVVRGPGSAVAAAAAMPYVGWTGPYHAGYKVAPALLERAGTVAVTVVGFGAVDQGVLASRVASLGGTVREAWSYPATVLADLPASQLAALARSPDVLSIQEQLPLVTMDKTAGQIHKFHNAWETRRSGLPFTLTGRSPGPNGVMYDADDYYEGAGVQDTGLDEGDPNQGANDFFLPSDRVIRFKDQTGASTKDGRCGSAHGSHVAGIIASNGYSWEAYLLENVGDTSISLTDKEWHKSEAGVAPEAKLSVDGVQAGNALFCSSGVATNAAYWDCQYLNGYITVAITAGVSSTLCGAPWIDGGNVATHNTAIDAGSRAYVVIHSNSWGSGSRTYNAFATASDTRINNAPERIVVFAAGNSGPELNTVSGEALLKNGLTIAAGQNFRPEQFESDNPNLLAGFSSRGGPGQSIGRIKPDLTAIGTSVVSQFAHGETLSAGFTPGADLITQVDKYCSLAKAFCSAGDAVPDYRYLQGTSMATPHAAGLAMLVREYLREVVANNNPASPFFNAPSYLVKAILVNGAVRMDANLYEYPGYDQGWGRIDLEQSLFPPVPRTNQIAIGEFTTTGTWTPPAMNLNVVSGDVPLKATLVWLDAPGDALSRNLDLRVRSPSGAEYHGNQYTNGWSDSTKTAYDNVNVIEQVEVQAPESGAWTVEVRGVSIPSAAKFALVFSADIGPQAQYKVDLRTTFPTAVSLSPLGSATIPVTALNYGTVADTVGLSSNTPAGLTVTYYPSNAIPLASTESQDALAVISASAAISPGIYEFDLRAVSANDPSATPASDFVPVRVEVLSAPLPFPIQVTNGTVDELDPSVLTFNDPAVGGSHIFIAYRKTSKVSANRLTGGVNVWVARTTLDASGNPVLPFTHTLVSNANEDPNDLRLLRLHAGSLKNRVVLTWTGSDPAETNPDAVSWSRIAYLDPPYTGTWTLRTIQKNEGTTADPCKVARVSFPLFRAAPAVSPNGQLIYVWESLLFSGGCATLGNVQSYAKISTDGGATWGATTQVFPPPGNSNFYFFPNGYVDQNDVAWVFVYWRTPTGNDRDLTVRLFDNAGWSTFPRNDYTILDTADNVQWPAVLSTTEGGGNRIYVTFTRDNLQADLKMYLMYTQGTYSSATLPLDYRDPGATSCGTGCTLSASFSAPNGSGLKGPLGTSVSSANFNRRPILNVVATGDGIVWLPHLENANPYGTPNLYTYLSGDGFNTNQLTILTSDAFAKGHQMTSTLTSGARHLVYEVYHSSRGTVTDVNYEVYLLIYFSGWPTAADTAGPLVTGVAGTPNPVNRTATFRLTANLNDITTGNSNIAAAEYSIDTAAPPGTGTAMAALDAFNSPTEAVFADIDVGALGWADAECHFLFVRGRDAANNWGPAASVEQCTEEGNIDRIPPVAPVMTRAELAPTIADVRVTWSQSSDEGIGGGTVLYRVYRATGIGGALAQVATVTASAAGTYTYVDTAAGDGDANVYRYRIASVDAAGNEAMSVAQGGKFTRTLAAGWQVVSVPLVQADPSLAKVFQTLSFSRARTYVASDAADPWKAWVQGKPFNDFTTVDINRAIWVMVSVPNDALVVAGLVPTGVTIPLQPGWNFVGFPTFRSTPYTVGDLQSAVPAVTAVEGYDTLGPYFLRRLAPTDAITQGNGYWVFATAAATWTVP